MFLPVQARKTRLEILNIRVWDFEPFLVFKYNMSFDYSNIGLDENLRKLGGIAAEPSTTTTAYDFQTQNQRNIINNYSVSQLSFEKISGGTANFGGTANGDGLISVANAGGTEIVKIDNTGIAVTNGSISIKDSSGSVVIDSTGLNSVTTFQSGQVTLGSARTTTNTSYEDISNLSITLSLARTSKVLINANITGYHCDADGIMTSRILYNGTAIGPEFISGIPNYIDVTGAYSYIYLAPSGAGTIKAQFRQNNIGGTGVIDGTFLSSGINYLVLGK